MAISRSENSAAVTRSFTTDGTTTTSSVSKAHIQVAGKPLGNALEAYGKALGSQPPSAPPKDVFAAAFNLIGGLFKPQSQAGGQPTFDLGRLLTDALTVAENLFGKDLEKAARKAGGDDRKGRAANAPDSAGTIDSGNGRIKIVPGASDGVRGIKDAGQLDLGGSADLGGGTRAKGSVKGGTFSGVTSQSSAGVDAEGNLYAQGGFAAGAGVRVRAEGEIEGAWGNVKGGVGAEAQVYAHGRAAARLGLKGAEATAAAGVGAMAGVNADAEANIGDGALRGKAKAEAKAGTGADAVATATVSYSPLEAAFSGAAGAFAGARATAEAKGTIAGVGYKVGAEAWAGVGAKIGLDAGIKEGKFSFELNVGVALGVGVAATIGFEIDTKDLFSVARGIVGAAGALLDGILKPVGDAVAAIAKPLGDAAGAIARPLGDVFGGLFSTVNGLFGGKAGEGLVASDVVDRFCSLARTMPDEPAAGHATSSKTPMKPAPSRPTPDVTNDRAEARALQDAPLPANRLAPA
ncbi:MAG: hypothetical protein INH41_15000 [Myxococcaceae bacterium]|nr:hypothetical protein [Myxococcaceae bacterium]MCA3013688.1 hypothetical protein [Myxococcaceae bacterium]